MLTHTPFPPLPLTQPAVRGLDRVRTCQELRLGRVAAWLAELLARPAECCEVTPLAPEVRARDIEEAFCYRSIDRSIVIAIDRF